MKNKSSTRLLMTATVTFALVSSGCVSTTLQLASDHPARTDAPSGRVDADPAALLRPNAPLYPSTESENRELAQRDSPAPDGSREAPFVGQGVIRALAEDQLQIEHGMIPGFMMAMTMTFPVSPEAMSDALKVGDEIVFRMERLPDERIQIFSIDPVTAGPVDAPENETGHGHDVPDSTGSSVAQP